MTETQTTVAKRGVIGDTQGKIIKGFDGKPQARVVRALIEEAEGIPEAESNLLGSPNPC